MIARRVFVLWLAAATLPALGQSQSQDRYVLSAPRVAKAISDRGLASANAEVSIAAKVVATEPDPALDVLSVSPKHEVRFAGTYQSETWIKLGCHLPGRCLPFYAKVTGSSGAESGPIGGSLAQAPDLAVVRAGTHATLIMDDSRAHIQVTVVCLESGMAGHRIRVASLDHKHSYVAEVVSAQLLKGSF